MFKYDLPLDPPLMNAAGMLGFAPEARHAFAWRGLGAFVTNPVSLASRSPAHGTRWLPYPGGFLLHSGHPNPGLKAVLRQYAARWANSELPVVVHVLANTALEVAEMTMRLEAQEGVAALELGLPPELDPAGALAFVQAALGELPVIVRLPLGDAQRYAAGLLESGAAAFSLGAPRGVLANPSGGLVSGRLYGPGSLPLALAETRALAALGLPVLGAGGIYRPADLQAFYAAGAAGIQLDTVLWRSGLRDLLSAPAGS